MKKGEMNMKHICGILGISICMSLLIGCGSSSVQDSSAKAEVKTAEANTTAATEAETVLYESTNVRITYRGESESFMGSDLQLKIENLSQQGLTVQARDVSVNGVMMNPIFSADVMPGKVAMDSLSFFSSDLETNQIEKIETVELSFHIFNSDTWDTIEDTEAITLTLQ